MKILSFNKILTSIVLLLGINSIAQAQLQVLDLAKVAELACHRIDRLVVLGKIDANFKNQLNAINISQLDSNASGAKYLVTVSQNMPADKSMKPLSVELYLDPQGKALKQNVIADGQKGMDVTWSDRDPDTLAENALHYLLDNGDTNDSLRPFLKDLSTLSISQETVNGQLIAQVSFVSKTTTNVLNISLKLDGTFIEFKIKQ